MTLQELYQNIEGNYDQALRVLRIEKLLDKHIRKLPKGGTIEALIAAGESMDPTALFETSHAVKGICGNLGLVKLAAAASEISEEYRPGNPRTMTDEQVKGKLAEIAALYAKTAQGIAAYENG
jgi:HPt (histidine-containing phosphotransfer) domain-containing protein